MGLIKVMLAENLTIVRKGLSLLLEENTDIQVVGGAENGKQALEMAEKLSPDILITEINLPQLNGFEVCKRIVKKAYAIKPIILSTHYSEEFVFKAIAAGAKGYLCKRIQPQELVLAIQAVHRGHAYFSPEISKIVLEKIVDFGQIADGSISYQILTKREEEVLQLAAEGKTSKEISEILFLSLKTIESHRSHIMKKLNINNLAGLIKYALRKGIIQL